MFQIKAENFSTLILPASAAASPSDNDGVHLDSEPHIQAAIIKAAAEISGVELFSDIQLTAIRGTFGQADNLMSQALYDVLINDPSLSKNLIDRQIFRDDFVPFFIDARREVWSQWTKDGTVQPKPFLDDYLNEFRTSDRLLGLVTGMPFDIARESVSNVLRADDLIPLTRERRVCCDDPRLEGRGKPDPRGYELGMQHFVEKFDISPKDMWIIEDRANGAVAALRAQYSGSESKYANHTFGWVVVIPDASDGPLEVWDKKNLLENHLREHPEDRKRIHFLHSLGEIGFTK